MPSGPVSTRKMKTHGSTCLNENASYRLFTQQDVLMSSFSSLSLHVHSANVAYFDKQCDESAFLRKGTGSFLITSSLINGVIPASQGPVGARISPHSARQNSNSTSYNGQNASAEMCGTSFRGPTLDAVSEDLPWEDQCMAEEGDSESSLGDFESSLSSSLNETPVDSFNSVDSQLTDDSEAQSSFSGSADHLSSPETRLRLRKGLSRFYVGKSRSFSCLRDVTSVKDLAKPENPYARKRKNMLGCSSTMGISKKSSNANKCTLALGMAMGAEDSDYLSISGGSWQSFVCFMSVIFAFRLAAENARQSLLRMAVYSELYIWGAVKFLVSPAACAGYETCTMSL